MDNSIQQGRRSIRLKDFDYSSNGAYFVTICVQDRRHLFGKILDGRMILSPAGDMVENAWTRLPLYSPFISVDEFIVMPDHIHGIILIGPADNCDGNIPTGIGGQAQGLPLQCNKIANDRGGRISLPNIIRIFKSLTTLEYTRGVSRRGWPLFTRRLWQRNYYERVIRNEEELACVREYIRTNPQGL